MQDRVTTVATVVAEDLPHVAAALAGSLAERRADAHGIAKGRPQTTAELTTLYKLVGYKPLAKLAAKPDNDAVLRAVSSLGLAIGYMAFPSLLVQMQRDPSL